MTQHTKDILNIIFLAAMAFTGGVVASIPFYLIDFHIKNEVEWSMWDYVLPWGLSFVLLGGSILFLVVHFVPNEVEE